MAKKTKQPEQNLIVSTSHDKEGFADITISEKGSDDISIINVHTPRSMYIAIGDKVVYIDYTLDSLLVTSWTNKEE